MITCPPENRSVDASIANGVCRALREELATYPKPGLVSPVDCGSHPDMDAACFEDSIACLEPFFARLAAAGSAGAGLAELQMIGLEAEAAMLAVTGGRNTHRGAIFSLGLLAAAAGWQAQYSDRISLGEIVCERWGRDLPLPSALPETSDGIAMARRYGCTGARGEAKAGFPSVYRHGLPVLRDALRVAPRREAVVQTFFTLLVHCEDSTLLKRGGAEGRAFATEAAGKFLQSGGVFQSGWEEQAVGIHNGFVARNLTAGGVADLLAATLFIHDQETGS